ncbi:MAG: MFS transporter [Candidatus Heimdallarchaeota archaeon]|nr:MFS transporter [Candidatus Heimdallarchaeota archaeon]
MSESNDITVIEAKKTSLRNVFLWSSYDAADTLFSQGILSIVFQPLVLLLAFEMGVSSYWQAFALMSTFMAVSNLLVAIFGPLIGALSDTIGKRKSGVIIAAAVMCGATLLFMVWMNFWWLCICFLFANFGYQAGRMFYDSMIPFISKTEERGRTSGISGALSFIGTFAGLGLAQLVYGIWGQFSKPTDVFEDHIATPIDYTSLYWMIPITVGVIALFAIPFFFSKEKTSESQKSFKENLSLASKDYKTTFGEIFKGKNKNALYFILGWFFITDAANTTILYMNIMIIDGAGASPGQALIVMAVGGVLSMVGAIIVGFLLDKWGPKKNFIINACAWFIAVVIGILACIEVNGEPLLPWQVLIPSAFFIGVGFGGLWIIGRQFVLEVAPPDRVTQYQGFKQIAGRVSAIVSPLMFLGFMAIGASIGLSIPNQFAIALSPLLLFFIIGYFFIRKYVSVHKEYLAGERAPYKKFQ